jgi:hypothetical protein
VAEAKDLTMTKKPRLYSKRKLKMPKPSRSSKGKFELRTIHSADGRFHVVKQMRERVAKLVEDCNADTIQKEWLCGRAVYIHSFLESQELDAVEGKDMNWRVYLQAVRALSDVLKALGLDKAVRGAQRLENYLLDAGKQKNGKAKVRS